MSLSPDGVPTAVVGTPENGWTEGVPVVVGVVVSSSRLRFSFPPAFEGRGAFRSLVPAAVRASGVADTSLEPSREPFLLPPIFDGALATAPDFFLSGFSGAGHSTSWLRSIRLAGIHSGHISIGMGFSVEQGFSIPSNRLLNST